jgi:hypothetical protein
LNLTGNGIDPLSQFPLSDELSAFILAMDKDDVCPVFGLLIAGKNEGLPLSLLAWRSRGLE